MGQTLTHGVYLPDEGERNCYNGLAANWSILDGAVGTIAEHTSQIAGKANAVHTHSKADITDFPAYGTTAGTICEGNDSRLSDARTPVAHTHTKSDVTDLFNSDNTWSGSNSFSKHQIFQAGAYFYNSDSTAATSSLNLRNSKVTKGGTSDSGSQIIQFLDKDNKFLSQVITAKALSGTTQLQFVLGNIDNNNNSITGGIIFSLAKDGTKQFLPGSDNTHNLGSSSYRWKTLNGVNPGALSLPDYNNVLDVTSEVPIASLDGNTQININDYLADKTGWLSIVIDDTAGNSIMVTQGKSGGVTAFNNSRTFHTGAQSNGYISVFFPMIAGLSKKAFIKASSLIQMRFYYCLGNV